MVNNEIIIQGGNVMKLLFEKEANNLIIKLKGKFDLHTAQYFKTEVNNHLEKNINGIVLDLEDIDFIDSSGIGAIISIYKKIEKKNRKIAIINVSPILRRILELSGLLNIIEIYNSRNKALESI